MLSYIHKYPRSTNYLKEYDLNSTIFFLILVQEVQEEGRHAIDDPGAPNAPEIPPEDYILRKYNKNGVK